MSVILYILSALLLASGIFLVIRQYVLIPGQYVAPEDDIPSPSPSNTAEVTPSATPAPHTSAPVEVTPSPTPYVKPVPVRIYFTDDEIMCDIVPVGIIEEGDQAGQMATVDDPDLAAWYEPGPAPGEDGNAIINGHKSWKGKKGRFSVLWGMEPGDRVAIAYEDGSITYFEVTTVDFYPYDDVPVSVMDPVSDSPRLTLITCYGEFDHTAETSVQRCVVVCEPVSAAKGE